MNCHYKVVWNRSLGCFTAVAEHAKSQGKSSTNIVSASPVTSTAVTASANLLKLSTICIGLATAGFSMQAAAAGLDFTGDNTNTTINRQTDEKLAIQGGVADPLELTAGNIGVFANDIDNTLNVRLAKEIDLTSTGNIEIGNNNINNDGMVLLGGPNGTVQLTNAGLNNGNNKILRVAKGDINDTSTDAVNGSQLYAVADSITNHLGGGATFDSATGTVTAPTYTVNNVDTNNVGAAITELDKGFNLQSNGANSNAVKAGDIIDIGTADGESNITVTKTGNVIDFGLANVINIGNNNPVTIDGNAGTVSGLTNTTFDANTNYTGGQAATQEQLSALNTNITDLGFKIADNNGNEDLVKLGETVTYNSTDSSIVTTVSNNQVDFSLGSDLNVGGAGQNGAPGKDGSIGVNGADGVAGVAINGKDGTIGLTGANGANGVIGVVNGTPGVDGIDGITRIIIDDIEVATMQDGLKFAGNTGDTIAKKINETLSIEGELTATADSTGANLRVDSDGDQLNLVMAKNLTDLDSADFGGANISSNGLLVGDTFVNQNGFGFNNSNVLLGNNGLNNGGNKITNVADGTEASDAVNFGQLNNAIGNANKGFDISAQGNNSSTVAPGSTVDLNNKDGNITVSKDQNSNDVSFDLNKDLNLDSATFGNVNISTNGLNNGGNKITNVSNGSVATNSKDAVNGGQLNATANSITSILGGNATNVGGVITNTNIGGTGKDTIDEAIRSVGDAVTQAKSTVTQGDNIVVTQTTNQDGSTDYKVETSKDLSVDSVTAGDSTLNNEGLTVTGGPNNDVKLSNTGLDNGGNIITNVGAGVADTDAVNVGQLNQVITGANKGFNVTAQGVNESNVGNGGSMDFHNSDGNITVTKPANSNDLSFDLNKDLTVDRVTTGNTVVNSNGIAIKDGPSMTIDGINASNKVVTGVADGRVADGSTDAINGGQLHAFGNNINHNIDNINNRVNDVEDGANAGVSSAMAMSSIPQSFLPGKSMVGGGIATYNGESAVAVGVSRVTDNGRWVIKVNGTADTQGNAGGTVGAGFHF